MDGDKGMGYPTDLTDTQWEMIKGRLVGMRTDKWPKWELVNAVLYVEKAGCQWRLLKRCGIQVLILSFCPLFSLLLLWMLCVRVNPT